MCSRNHWDQESFSLKYPVQVGIHKKNEWQQLNDIIREPHNYCDRKINIKGKWHTIWRSAVGSKCVWVCELKRFLVGSFSKGPWTLHLSLCSNFMLEFPRNASFPAYIHLWIIDKINENGYARVFLFYVITYNIPEVHVMLKMYRSGLCYCWFGNKYKKNVFIFAAFFHNLRHFSFSLLI